MVEHVARLLRFADESEEGARVDPRVALLRHGVEVYLAIAGSMDRESSMAGHEGPSTADADELRHQGGKLIQFACALGFDAVDEASDSEEEMTTSAAPVAPARRKRRPESSRRAGKNRRLSFGSEQPDQEEEDKEVPAANGGSSKKPKCGGRNPWAVKLKKPIIHDTEENLPLGELVTDLHLGVAAGYDGRQMSDELNELVAEYARSKADRPVEEQSLFALIGREGAQTTEQRLSVAMMKGKPELGRFVGDIEQSAPSGLHNVVSQVRAFVRPAGAGMPFHRDSIDLGLDRVVFTLLSGPSDQPPEFHVKLMSGPKATAARGPYGPDELHIPKENGRIMVKGPMARGEQVRVVHGVKGGDVESLTLVADYSTTRTDGQATTRVDRDGARQSVVDRAESRMPPIGATHNLFADRLVLSDTAPRTTGSRRATEANNAKVWDGSAGKWVKAASRKGNNSNFGKTKNDTVSAASARVAAATAALAAADTRVARTAATKTLDEETKKHKLVVKAMDGRATGGKTGGKGTQGTQISSTGGRRGPGGRGENVDISSLRTSIGPFPRAFQKADGTVVAPKGKSEFFIYRIPGVNGGTATLGLHAYDSNGKVVTLSYPSDQAGKEIAKTVGITNRLYNGTLVTKAKDEIRRSGGNKVGAK